MLVQRIGWFGHQYVVGVERVDGMLTVGGDGTGSESAPLGAGADAVSRVATEHLYADHHDALVQLAFLLTGSRAVAEDVVHDAFLQVHSRQAMVHTPVAYVRAAVVNGCRMHHRRNARERARLVYLLPETVQPETPVVLDALGALPARQRDALVLRFYADLPEVEIAELIGCRPATVRSLVRRGLAALRKVMEQ